VCIGRIAAEKRIERIAEILSILRDGGDPLHLHIIGTYFDGAYAAAFSRTCDDSNRS
jgi:glycosyltransferase involved in cell wall biosynthesis